MLRSLVEGFHRGGSHSQRQRRIKTTQLQLYQLEALRSSKLPVRKQVIELLGSSNRAVVLGRVFWTEGICKLGVVPVWELVVCTGNG